MRLRDYTRQILIIGVIFPAVSLTLATLFLTYEYEAQAPGDPYSGSKFSYEWDKDYLTNESVEDPNATECDEKGYYRWEPNFRDKWSMSNVGVAVYWSLTTMTTVGYGDITPSTPDGYVVTTIQFFAGIMLYGYIVSLIASIFVEANFREMFGMNKCKYTNHIVISDWNPIAEVILKELLQADRKVAVITSSNDEVGKIQQLGEKKDLIAIHGDVNNDETLLRANLKQASTFIACSDDDSNNLIATIHARNVNPNLRIIARVKRDELKDTLHVAGVSYISSPYELSGRLMASAAFEPEVVNVIEDLSGAEGYDIRQYTVKEGVPIAGKRFEEAFKLMRHHAGSLLIGYATQKKDSTEYDIHLNPADSTVINVGAILLTLGDDEANLRAQAYLQVEQGRL